MVLIHINTEEELDQKTRVGPAFKTPTLAASVSKLPKEFILCLE